MYPSTMSAFNISKETQLATILKINGYPQQDVEFLCSNIIQPDINAVAVCEHFFGLPSYNEMKDIFQAYLDNKS